MSGSQPPDMSIQWAADFELDSSSIFSSTPFDLNGNRKFHGTNRIPMPTSTQRTNQHHLLLEESPLASKSVRSGSVDSGDYIFGTGPISTATFTLGNGILKSRQGHRAKLVPKSVAARARDCTPSPTTFTIKPTIALKAQSTDGVSFKNDPAKITSTNDSTTSLRPQSAPTLTSTSPLMPIGEALYLRLTSPGSPGNFTQDMDQYINGNAIPVPSPKVQPPPRMVRTINSSPEGPSNFTEGMEQYINGSETSFTPSSKAQPPPRMIRTINGSPSPKVKVSPRMVQTINSSPEGPSNFTEGMEQWLSSSKKQPVTQSAPPSPLHLTTTPIFDLPFHDDNENGGPSDFTDNLEKYMKDAQSPQSEDLKKDAGASKAQEYVPEKVSSQDLHARVDDEGPEDLTGFLPQWTTPSASERQQNDTELLHLKEMLKHTCQEASSKQGALEEKDAEIKRLNELLEEARREISTQKVELRKKDADIMILNESIDQAHQDNEETSKEMATLRRRKHSDAAQFKISLEHAHQEVLQHQVAIRKLDSELSRANELLETHGREDLRERLNEQDELLKQKDAQVQATFEEADLALQDAVKELQERLDSSENEHQLALKQLQDKLDASEHAHQITVNHLQELFNGAEHSHKKSVQQFQDNFDEAAHAHQQAIKQLQDKLDASEYMHQTVVRQLEIKLNEAESSHQDVVKQLQEKLDTSERGHRHVIMQLQDKLLESEYARQDVAMQLQDKLEAAEYTHLDTLMQLQDEVSKAKDSRWDTIKQLQERFDEDKSATERVYKQAFKEYKAALQKHYKLEIATMKEQLVQIYGEDAAGKDWDTLLAHITNERQIMSNELLRLWGKDQFGEKKPKQIYRYKHVTKK